MFLFPGTTLENRTNWDTNDLARFFAAACEATGVFPRSFIAVPSPIRSRGCAEIPKHSPEPQRGHSSARVVISVASPSHFTRRRLARLLEHELGHAAGLEHRDMDESLKFSLGQLPDWARGLPLRWRQRAKHL
jgi:hypothetical protein